MLLHIFFLLLLFAGFQTRLFEVREIISDTCKCALDSHLQNELVRQVRKRLRGSNTTKKQIISLRNEQSERQTNERKTKLIVISVSATPTNLTPDRLGKRRRLSKG